MNEWKTIILGDVCGGSLPLAPTSLVATPSPKWLSPLKTPKVSREFSQENSIVSDSERPTPPSLHTDLFAANAAHGIMEK